MPKSIHPSVYICFTKLHNTYHLNNNLVTTLIWYRGLTGMNILTSLFFITVPCLEDSPSRYQKNCTEKISFETGGEYIIIWAKYCSAIWNNDCVGTSYDSEIACISELVYFGLSSFMPRYFPNLTLVRNKYSHNVHCS
jgi:hypothetical protein